MPLQPQKPDTATIEVPKYEPAQRKTSSLPIDTGGATLDVRTVVTKMTHGVIGLRYSPQEPGISSAKTSS